MPTEQKRGLLELLDACQRVVRYAHGGAAPTASTYALSLIKARMPSDPALRASFIETQCLYILSNLAHWRGEEAKQVKAILRYWANVH